VYEKNQPIKLSTQEKMQLSWSAAFSEISTFQNHKIMMQQK